MNRHLIEALETRRLYSADFTFKSNRLTIDGDAGDNDIVVTLTPNRFFTVTVDGVTEPPYFQKSVKDVSNADKKNRVVKRFWIIGNDGNDTIRLESLPAEDDPATDKDESKKALNFRTPATLVGANGNDTIISIDGSDTLIGGAGDDVLDSGESKDLIYGGSGDDIVMGNSGKNLLIGQDGDDQIIGGRDRDVMYGMLGDDFYQGNGGNNTIFPTGSSEVIDRTGDGQTQVRQEDYDDFVNLYVSRLIRLTMAKELRDFARQ